MEFWRNRKTAALVLALAVAAAVLFGGWRSLSSYARRVENVFTAGAERDGLSIQGDLDQRLGLSANLQSIAGRYLSADDPLLTELTAARTALAAAKTPHEKYEANRRLTDAAAALNAVLLQTSLSEQDERYRSGQYASLLACNETISRDPYNQQAQAFNEALEDFPASLIAKLTAIKPLELYR